MVSMYDKACDECSLDEEKAKLFKERLYDIVEESDGVGWSYHDELCDIYFSMGWDEEE